MGKGQVQQRHETREIHEDRSGRVGPGVRDPSLDHSCDRHAWIGHKGKRNVHHGSLPQQLLPRSLTHSYGKGFFYMECASTDGHVRNTHGCPADKHLRNPTGLTAHGIPVRSEGLHAYLHNHLGATSGALGNWMRVDNPDCHTARDSHNIEVSIGSLRFEYVHSMSEGVSAHV